MPCSNCRLDAAALLHLQALSQLVRLVTWRVRGMSEAAASVFAAQKVEGAQLEWVIQYCAGVSALPDADTLPPNSRVTFNYFKAWCLGADAFGYGDDDDE